MEIEKPFKCTVCNAQFTNEDHLQVHKRRHEMSLNLSKSGSLQQQSLLEGFVDETPTPTRFFRNCEEVGLFQDLQNVNPFDEQFSKASATPSTGGEPFDFSLAISSSSVPPSASTSSTTALASSNSHSNSANNSSKRRYSDQDTLNTPQVLGFVVNLSSSTTNTCSTTSILTPMPPFSGTLDSSNNISNKSASGSTVKSGDSNDYSGQASAESASSSSTETSYKPFVSCMGVVSSPGGGRASKSKLNLKLKLSPSMHIVLEEPDSPDSSKRPKTLPLEPEKKAELLERNRAAASRSRQRRKQWVSSLESKCQMLESLLASTRADLAKQQTENQLLRNELSRHANCDVSRQTENQGGGEITILVQQAVSQPNILRQVSQTQSAIFTAVSQSGDTSQTQILSPVTVLIPRVKAKRGRPRKGNERRIDPLSIDSAKPSSSSEVPFKVQISPVSRTVTETQTHIVA